MIFREIGGVFRRLFRVTSALFGDAGSDELRFPCNDDPWYDLPITGNFQRDLQLSPMQASRPERLSNRALLSSDARCLETESQVSGFSNAKSMIA